MMKKNLCLILALAMVLSAAALTENAQGDSPEAILSGMSLRDKVAAMNNQQYGDKTYVGWNFTKFLIDREGQVVARFKPTADMKEVRAAVEAALYMDTDFTEE